MVFWILTGAAAVVLIGVLMIAYICYRIAFYAPPRQEHSGDTVEIPEGEIYEVFREQMETWGREVRALPYEAVTVTSFDGLTLHGKFYEYAPGATVSIGENRGLCSYYAENGGVLVGYEKM